MLEIPEAIVFSKQIEDLMVGKRIAKVIAGYSPHGFAFYSDTPETYESLLVGKIVDRAYAIAGQIEIVLSDVRLLFGDGATNRFLKADDKRPQKHQLYIEFDDGAGLVTTVQMYGMMYAFLDGTNDNFYYLVAKEKPSPLTGDFDESWFDSIRKDEKPNLSVKALLATEQRIPGLGNGGLQDILFNAGVNPQSRISAIGDEAFTDIFMSIKQTLGSMVSGGGRNTEKNLLGQPGGYRTILSAKTLADPCPKCGSAIQRKAYLGGNVYFCPVCQPLKK